ncbi:hypothetical protein ANCCEY_14403 [Ancylostoma ceylanicum]|uniref:Bestrophin homolog n=1 Tax=Ancylostoma ceylanicum TaxID=53326 RepID=A0A0D6L561_9BILA|nr:hypothetical protein ANCCEY_14403 [Ancylostoma ceylanicum]
MTGVLCDKNVPDRFKSKVYRAVVRSVALYGAECWPATKEVERRLSVMETKMLRWTAGVTRADRIRFRERAELSFPATVSFKMSLPCKRRNGDSTILSQHNFAASNNRKFEKFAEFCDKRLSYIPMNFMLGFFVTVVVTLGDAG